ncbi:dihydroxyacetone kinase subunit DhaL [Salipaludibacillus daqingensis]|uniref:dihydroxyacetone kinase subunit DhaL n=1 Tax=Salipaludibacillus daqingensis TaxID=3041001 RepID=UPI002475461A|nr:dihydroxyacetone kinase subunit DhaL [Salipaludibacillus daqingensis]
MNLTVKTTISWLEKFDEKIQVNKDLLTDLDQAIGDGDHGINMSRGLTEVMKTLESKSFQTIGDLIKGVAMTLIGKVGGASGPLYGSAFLKMGAKIGAKEQLSDEELLEALKEGEQAIIQRGKASVGEKTMVDVWSPLLEDFSQETHINWEDLKVAAHEKMTGTKDLHAKKGRAAYLGARSVGHIDPGAMSSYLLFESLAETMMEGENNNG